MNILQNPFELFKKSKKVKTVLDAKKFIYENDALPICPHANYLMDWGYSALQPKCGCKLQEEEKQWTLY